MKKPTTSPIPPCREGGPHKWLLKVGVQNGVHGSNGRCTRCRAIHFWPSSPPIFNPHRTRREQAG